MEKEPKPEVTREKITNPEDINFLKKLAEEAIELGKIAEEARAHFDADAVILWDKKMEEIKDVYNTSEPLKTLKDFFESVGSEVYPKE